MVFSVKANHFPKIIRNCHFQHHIRIKYDIIFNLSSINFFLFHAFSRLHIKFLRLNVHFPKIITKYLVLNFDQN